MWDFRNQPSKEKKAGKKNDWFSLREKGLSSVKRHFSNFKEDWGYGRTYPELPVSSRTANLARGTSAKRGKWGRGEGILTSIPSS